MDTDNTNYYILISADTSKNLLHTPSALGIANYRLKRKEWNVNKQTSHRTHVKTGDKVIIYISGVRKLRQHFIASAELLSGVKNAPLSMREMIDAPKYGNFMSPYYFELKYVNYFIHPVDMRKICGQLNRVKNPACWWNYIQGGIIKIDMHDYNIILEESLGKP